MSDLAEAPDTSTEISVDLEDEALDERLLRFQALEELIVRSCPEQWVLPDLLLKLPKLRRLRLHSDTNVRTRVPELVARLPLTELGLDNVDVEHLPIPPTLTSLLFWSKQAPKDLEVLLPRLGQLTKFMARAEGDAPEGQSWVLPASIGTLTKVESLDLSDFDDRLPDSLAQLKSLKSFELSTTNLPVTIRALARDLPHLTSLELNASDAQGDLPEELGQLTQLESLTIFYVDVGDLPASVTQLKNLRKLRLQRLKGQKCPAHLCDLQSLTSLTLGAMPNLPPDIGRLTQLTELTLDQVNTLPPELANLTQLKKLNLARALNKGPLVSRFDKIERLKALPKVLCELTSLEELNLDSCGVFDTAPLRPLTRLRVLDLGWAPISTLEDIGMLTELEELSLEHVDRVQDLSPLANLKKLRTLNLENTRPSSVDVLTQLPALKQLKLDSIKTKKLTAVYSLDVELSADDEVLEQYQKRAELRKLPPIAAIVANLASPDAAVVEAALEHLATWVTASSTRDDNAIFAALDLERAKKRVVRDDDDEDGDEDDDLDEEDVAEDGDEDDGSDEEADEDAEESSTGGWSGKALPQLDAALDRHLKHVSPSVLARVFGALFHQMHEDFAAANRLAEEVATRGDDAAQVTLVEGFVSASEYYDSGHRMWENTTQDVLIEDVFPKLGGRALTALLTSTDDGSLSEDGLADLLGPAFARASATDLPALTARLEKYAKRTAEYADDEETMPKLWAMFDALPAGEARSAVELVRVKLAKQLAEQEARAALEKDLKDIENVPRVMAALKSLVDAPEGTDIPTGALWRTNECTGLDLQGLELLMRLWIRKKNESGQAETLALAALKGVAAAQQVAALLNQPDSEIATLVRSAVTKLLREELQREQREAREREDEDEDFEDESEGDDDDTPTTAALPTITRRSTPQLETLRAWVNRLEQIDEVEGQRREALAIFEELGSFEDEWMTLAIESVVTLSSFSLTEELQDKFADDLGQMADNEELWPHFRLLARHLKSLSMSGRELERVLAQLIAICMRSKDDEGTAALVALVPAELTWDILAFNLACYFGVSKNKAELLRVTKRALELGKSPSQFLDDDDFAEYHDDVDFLALMKTVE